MLSRRRDSFQLRSLELKNKPAPERRAGFESLSNALAATKGAPEVKAIADTSGPAVQLLLQHIHELDEQDAKPVALPDVGEKPVFEKPDYHGSFYLTARRGNRDGDPVIQVGNNFFVVRGVTLWLEGHYGEASINTITLNIGREGREATFVDVVARETYSDDQERYAADVQTARGEYQKTLDDYNAALKVRQAGEAKARQEKQARAVERSKAQAQLRQRDREAY